MGESDKDLVDVVFALRDLDPDSVPVNFLIPFEGTPLAKEWKLTPQRCLRILAMVRFVCPDVEVRLAGGREVHLRSMQPLALHLVNSIFLGDYLTSEGQAGQTDLDMIADAGFEVEGAGTTTLPRHRADALSGGGCGSQGAPEAAGCGCPGGRTWPPGATSGTCRWRRGPRSWEPSRPVRGHCRAPSSRRGRRAGWPRSWGVPGPCRRCEAGARPGPVRDMPGPAPTGENR
ncbi:Biotin synthase [Streptomyces microflavus]